MRIDSYNTVIDDPGQLLYYGKGIKNHSCNLNFGIGEFLQPVTFRDITGGEKLNTDHPTSMPERKWILNCACDQLSCRKTIQAFTFAKTLTATLFS